MTTSRHPARPSIRRVTAAAAITVALILVLILGPAASRSYAASMFGTLRAPGEPALVAGHRGDRSTAPENTIPAFERALAGPMLFVETDVRLSADGVPVLIHDETVDRTSNGTGEVASMTLAQLKALDAGSWYSQSFTGTTIPTLEEFFELLAQSRKKAMVELKGVWDPTTVTLVEELAEQQGVDDRIIVASFEVETLAALQLSAAELPRVMLARQVPSDPVAEVSRYGAIALVTKPKALVEAPETVDRMHAAGLGVLLYTLNEEATWEEALSLGVDGIITDEPSSLDGWLASSSPGT